jgi:hypothetical protein
MAYKVNDTTVIDDTGNIQSVAGLTLNNDYGVISVASASPMVGTVSGYTSGGFEPPFSNVIDKFPFATDTNATDVGDLTQARQSPAGQSSATNGYTSGGRITPGAQNIIDKFAFATNTNATDVGNLIAGKYAITGTSSQTHGYTSSGFPTVNTIQKFPFSADSNTTDVGDLSQSRAFAGSVGQSSTTFGYHAGGYSGPPRVTLNTIDKFSFAADGNATDVGDLTEGKENASGQSSTSHGYSSGGFVGSAPPYVYSNVINKFPFSSDTNASDIGDLTIARNALAGQSSTVSGYTSGGTGDPSPPATFYNTVEKFPFATDTNATDVGDLSQTRAGAAGQQD